MTTAELKIAVVGSRKLQNNAGWEGIIHRTLYRLQDLIELNGYEITGFVSGGASGPDTAGFNWATMNAIPTQVFPAEWERFGKKAGFLRNIDIVKNSDLVVAFSDGISKGTAYTISIAKEHGKDLVVVDFGNMDIAWERAVGSGVLDDIDFFARSPKKV